MSLRILPFGFSDKMDTHTHHILPKHAGGSDDPSNLVELTVLDHAIAHKVLYGLYGRIQDLWAWRMLKAGDGHPRGFLGHKRPQEWKDEHSKKVSGENNHWFGKTFSDEHKEKLAQAKHGRVSNNPSGNPAAMRANAAKQKGKTWHKDPVTGKRVWVI